MSGTSSTHRSRAACATQHEGDLLIPEAGPYTRGMRAGRSVVHLIALTTALGACGGGGSSAPPVVIPEVPAGAFEAGCQQLCTLAAGESICTPKHAEFCVARCRAVTRDLPQACGDCLIAAGTPIRGMTDEFGPSCSAGGAGSLSSCRAACDDAGAVPPSPDLELLCQLECGFYTDEPAPLACSLEAVGDDWLGEVVGNRHQPVRVANDDALTPCFDEAIRLETADDSTHRIQRRPGHLRDVLS